MENSKSFAAISRAFSHPSVTITAVVIALALGIMRAPYLQYLRPLGEFYLALLQMCVLPFLLATIPLAVRSAMTSSAGGKVIGLLAMWLMVASIVVVTVSIIVSTQIFQLFPIDEKTLANIGNVVASSERVDIEFALDLSRASPPIVVTDGGFLALVTTNIFASLANNDTVRILFFSLIFGIAMVKSERKSEHSVFGSLHHIQRVCTLIFDWFNLFTPIGIIALIAPQVDMVGLDIFVMLAMFTYAFVAISVIVVVGSIIVVAISLRLNPVGVFTTFLKPLMLGVATRNTLVCVPLALETMKEELKVAREPCDLFIPLGFATLRFGIIVYFIVATIFMGSLLGRSFSLVDLFWIALLSATTSFFTLGVTGLAALAPLAAVLRSFGLSYELALPLLIIIDPIANMIRVMINIAVNCAIPAMASNNHPENIAPAPGPAK